MSMESGSTRNTLGSQLSTTSSTSHSSGSSKGTPSRKKEYWKKDRKIIRILTVVAYIASVSMAAVLLSTYYVFIWTSDVPLDGKVGGNQRNNRFGGGIRKLSKINAVTPPASHTGGPRRVLDFVQLNAHPTMAINQLGNDGAEDYDEYQQRMRPQDRIPSNEYGRSGSRKRMKNPKVYYSHLNPRLPPPREEDQYGEERDATDLDADLLSSGEHSDPVALPLVQNANALRIPLRRLPLPMLLTVSVVNEGGRNENDTRTNTNTRISTATSTSRATTNSVDKPHVSSEYDEDEYAPQYATALMNSNTTKPYRQRQIPTPSAPVPITKTISAFVLDPTTTEGPPSTTQLSSGSSSGASSMPTRTSTRQTVTTTQPMISLLWNASRLVGSSSNTRQRTE